MTVVNPKSISGINSITTGSGSDDILTIHNNNGTERLRIDGTGTTKITTGIVTTLTATSSAKVGSGVTLSPDGDVFATGVCTATSFVGSGANLTGISAGISNVVEDSTPQLGGNLDTNSFEIMLDDDHRVYFGDGNDLEIWHSPNNNSYIKNSTGELRIASDNLALMKTDQSETFIDCIADGAVELYHDNTKQCETSANGLAFPAGKGINFSATSDAGNSASMDSELLDDYEEGAWAPTMATGSATITAARYTKVGRLVHVSLYAHSFTDDSSDSIIQFDNLPFASDTNQRATGALLLALINTNNDSVAYIGGNLSNIRLYHYNQGGDYTSLNHSAITSTNSQRRVFLSITYQAA